MIKVMFACVHNAGRSQMATTFFNAIADPAQAQATSAGTHPTIRVHPEVIEVMREAGYDLSGVTPRQWTDERAQGVEVLVTMGCGAECPLIAGARREDWSLEDPKGQSLPRVRAIRDEIRRRVHQLVATEGWGRR